MIFQSNFKYIKNQKDWKPYVRKQMVFLEEIGLQMVLELLLVVDHTLQLEQCLLTVVEHTLQWVLEYVLQLVPVHELRSVPKLGKVQQYLVQLVHQIGVRRTIQFGWLKEH